MVGATEARRLLGVRSSALFGKVLERPYAEGAGLNVPGLLE